MIETTKKYLGCTTVNRLYVTPIGDVLVCPYVHIKIGNIFEQSLKEIVDYILVLNILKIIVIYVLQEKIKNLSKNL